MESKPSVIYRGEVPWGRITAEDYEEAIRKLQEAKTQLEPGGDNCQVCNDSGHQAWECRHNPLAMARIAAETRAWEGIALPWRCFYCGQVFWHGEDAARHFGNWAEEQPAACGVMLNAFAEEFERFGVHRNSHDATSVRILVRDVARRCTQIANELEDECTAEAVWEAIRDQFGLSSSEDAVEGDRAREHNLALEPASEPAARF